jgi:hypothetical protein
MNRKSRLLFLTLVLTLISLRAAAVPRPANPTLVGIKRVALAINLSHHPPAAETDALRKEIVARLANVGIRVDESAPMMLLVRGKRSEVASCPGLSVFRVSVGLWEDVRLRRGDRSLVSRVETWSNEREVTDAGADVRHAVLRAVNVFVDEVSYAETWKKSQ